MVKARRAKRSPARVVVPVVAAAAVLVAAAVWWRPWSDPNPTAVSSVAATSSADASSEPSTASPSASRSPAADPTGESSSAGSVAVALRQCRATVSDGDDVVAAARQGVGHWAAHVQAQTDADAGKISAAEMDSTFSRTRVAGNEQDEPLWAEVNTAWDADADADDPAAACRAPSDATAEQTAVFEQCQARADALPATIDAADDGMADWKTHLKHMRASRDHFVDDAEGIWLNDYGNASPHIKAWQKADGQYQTLPACS